MRTAFAFILAVALVATCLPHPSARAAASRSRLWGTLEPGPYGVGFRVRMERDATRGEQGVDRPVQVACWYPAEEGGAPLTFGDYFALSAEEHGEPPTADARRAAVDALKRQVAGAGIPAAAVDEWLAIDMAGRRDAESLGGAHELILVAQGNNQSIHSQAVLTEYLASYGYVACTSPSQARLAGPMKSEDDVLPHARAQAADLRVVARSAGARFRVAVPPGIVAHSFGARSALLYAAAAPVAALVSLDGGIGAAEARAWLDPGSEEGRETLSRVRTPLLHIFETTDPQMKPDFTLLGALPVKPTLIRVEQLHHWDFSVLGPASAAIAALRGEPPPRELPARLAAIADLTGAFLDLHVGGDAGAARRLAAIRAPWLHRLSGPAAPAAERRR